MIIKFNNDNISYKSIINVTIKHVGSVTKSLEVKLINPE